MAQQSTRILGLLNVLDIFLLDTFFSKPHPPDDLAVTLASPWNLFELDILSYVHVVIVTHVWDNLKNQIYKYMYTIGKYFPLRHVLMLLLSMRKGSQSDRVL